MISPLSRYENSDEFKRETVIRNISNRQKKRRDREDAEVTAKPTEITTSKPKKSVSELASSFAKRSERKEYSFRDLGIKTAEQEEAKPLGVIDTNKKGDETTATRTSSPVPTPAIRRSTPRPTRC